MDVLHPDSPSFPPGFSYSDFRPVRIPGEAFVDRYEVAREGTYTVVGERHDEFSYASDIIIPLLETGEFDKIFIEALLRGEIDYSKKNEENLGLENDFDYNPDKYQRIISAAERNGTEVHGLDAKGERKESTYLMVEDWVDYIRQNKGENNLALVGSLHVFRGFNYPPKEYDEMSYISIGRLLPDDNYTIAMARPGKEMDEEDITEGFYRLEDLPPILPDKFQNDQAADFVRISTSSY